MTTTDYSALIDRVAASACDLLFLCSYLQDSIGLVRAVRGHAFRPKMVGASMIGPQSTSVKTALGPLLNGFVNYEYWTPSPSLIFAGVRQFLDIYQARAVEEKVDLLGHYAAPLAYAQMQVIEQAVAGTGSLDDAALSDFARKTTFPTVMGDISFGLNGEWAQPRVLQVQFQDIQGHDPEQFRSGARQVVLSPQKMSSGPLIYPYASALA